MLYRIGDRVVLAGKPGTIRALVRADDDPRKCVPTGERFVRRGDIPERELMSYLIKCDGAVSLSWSHGRSLTPEITVTTGRGRSVLEAAQAISDGTMSYLTGYEQTAELSRARQLFLQHIIGSEVGGTRWSDWTEAWRYFVNGDIGDRLPAYTPADRLFLRVEEGQAPHDEPVWPSPFKSAWVRVSEKPLTMEQQIARGVDDPRVSLARVGFLRRYWFVGKTADRFQQWAAGAPLPTASA